MATQLDPRAQDLLADLAGPDATFRPHQLEAVRDLVEDRARVLCVQRTGWGKSAVYFIATALLRERGAGPALIVSPLLALMRNQIAAARAAGDPGAHDQLDQPGCVGGGAAAARRGRRRPAPHQPRAPEQPEVPRRDAAAVRRAGGAARGRRGALHLGLGARLPAGLPAARGDARAAAGGRGGPVHDGDGQRSRRGRRGGAARGRARGRAADLPRTARPRRACGWRSSTSRAAPTGSRGWRPGCRS